MKQTTIYSSVSLVFVIMSAFLWQTIEPFSLYMMARPRKGNLKQILDNEEASKSNSVKAMNQGRGQEITGVTLPAVGTIRGWEFAKGVRVACANVGGKYYAVQGDCPRCSFDLYRGKLVTDVDAFGADLPRVACPTCSTTFSFKTGKAGPPLKQSGLAGWVGNLAKTATMDSAQKDAKTFVITYDDTENRVFCRER